jgi:hypothetical protein
MAATHQTFSHACKSNHAKVVYKRVKGGTWGADSADRVAPRGSDVGEAEDSALELEVGEEVRQAEVLVAVLATEHLPPTPPTSQPPSNHSFVIPIHMYKGEEKRKKNETDLEEVAHVPLVTHHVVVRLPSTHPRRLRVHHNLLYHKSHALQAKFHKIIETIKENGAQKK